LQADFGISHERISVIPFGINDTTPTTTVVGTEARRRLGLAEGNRVMLFFGQIAPYKGLQHLVSALPRAFAADPALRLVIAGKVKKGCEDYWRSIEQSLRNPVLAHRVLKRIEHVPDNDVELYFKAADVLVIPYVQVFQSGVPFLAYAFGLPVIATDVGALRDDIVDGRTGFMCRPKDPEDLVRAIGQYFASALYADLDHTRETVLAYARDRHSWAKVAAISEAVYRRAEYQR
jgi:D-inositol-3-phosphate glycosyltransferase